MTLLNHKRVFVRTIISAIVFWVLFGIIGTLLSFWSVSCKSGGNCTSGMGLYLIFSWIIFPIIFLISLGLNYLIEHFVYKK